ncbi:AraC family transcriptional regulator [Raoultella ornithinolytica]|uniref:AraC family transcriptional regulator n=1 Tax=Raoultella ornithinolytica TaxID=54291 RepID=UPI00093E8143|nr:AraC family transcriptional regulator [Raoultella ornithinolytica]
MKLKNIHLYNYIILFTVNCEVKINNSHDKLHIPHNTIVILEKNIFFDIEIVKTGPGRPYEIYDLDNDSLSILRDILEPIVIVPPEAYTQKRTLKDKVFKIKPCDIAVEFFHRLKGRGCDNFSRRCKLSYLVSKCENIFKLAVSLNGSVTIRFSEKITQLLFSDLTKKWKISDIADELNISEISVRKKLEQESISFNQLLLDVRMNKAVKYILQGDHQIGMIASLTGYTSTSYFIKTFKDYYGITPKQFHVEIKTNHCWNKTKNHLIR